MIAFGHTHELEVVDQRPYGLVLGEDEIVLPRSRVPEGTKVGDRLRVFCYLDGEGRPTATMKMPAAQLGEFAYLRVSGRSRHGVFMHWGIEKDLFVPNDEQPHRLSDGERYPVFITTDKQGRMMGSARVEDFFDDDLSPLEVDARVRVMAYSHHERGVKVVIEQRWGGLVYADEIYRELPLGRFVWGWVDAIRDDNKIDVRLRERGSRGRLDARSTLLEALRAAGGHLALHDKSDPDEIRSTLHMSKKAFKRAVGNLLRAGVVTLDDDGVRLVTDDEA